MEKREELYAGKAKSVFKTDDPNLFVLEFRDDTSAFDGEKKEQLQRKGMVNNKFNAFIMEKLEAAGIPTHFEGLLSDTESLVKNLDMIPVECVVRNVSAGSLCRRLGVEEGKELTPPTFELFLKNDALHDPMVNESLAVSFGWASADELARMKELTYKVNDVLKALFDEAGMLLVDYKLEFGRSNGAVVLGDEFSPDGCRIWDKETRKKMDKDRFRQGLGEVIETYEEVGGRLGIQFD
ncbi:MULTISPECIES: phosphoribosylaminoimidazolesuccinocarboxamide synthase [Marinobacter]|uniref:Phosphoribosylaminoimidazole-succinocarboxamide synthase n=1 Tax=Marinobacter suaedae TaxID=3057675 RepID=A0ABT8W2G8_9GAMM|nr:MULTISPECIES: phosphoribosylaminoimidazolesuccinocarboxamide synthase [unclassified Marinobacter]MBZ2167828.1 phosphoribosylaminoimidazolesuccinocarboxamide synthase [Marinobacter sp. F4216]MDO3722440.1 phosphoribosylaminoimidazolesuccinocarboxamide synthase [Marinobacter sp. chi1]